MLIKFSFGFLFAVSFVFFACNSNDQSQKDNSNPQTNSVTKTPTDDIAWYEKTLEHDSLNIDLRIKLATTYYSAQEFDKAIYHLLKIYKIDNKNLTTLISLGNVYYDSEQNEKAIEFYEKAMAIDNKNIDMRCDLATCYFRMNDNEKAINILKENIKVHYNHAKSHYNLSVILKKSGKIAEADEEIKIFDQLTAAQKSAGS